MPVLFSRNKFLIFLSIFSLLVGACVAPKYVPTDLGTLNSPEELGKASQKAYQGARNATDKTQRARLSQAGIHYSDKCLKWEPKDPLCLYYNVLNRGVFLKIYFYEYQSPLKKMIARCKTLIEVDPAYEHAGCYRILGDIYAKVPSFPLGKKPIIRDLDLSAEYLEKAVNLAPDYALNHLFYAQTLTKLGDKEKAREQLKEFDRLISSNLDIDYPEWKKEREKLARRLQ